MKNTTQLFTKEHFYKALKIQTIIAIQNKHKSWLPDYLVSNFNFLSICNMQELDEIADRLVEQLDRLTDES